MLTRSTHGSILELRLDRPPANALAPELITRLADAVAAAPDEGFEALLVSGRPGMFSAGLDVPHLLALDRDGIEAAWSEFLRLLRSLASSPVPVGAAITGHAPAGGAVIAIFCDQRTMADGEWRIGLNEVEVGIALPALLVAPLVRLVGPGAAERLAVAGAMVSPCEAVRLGLVDEVVAPAEVVPRALARLDELLARPRRAMLDTRRLFRADLAAAFDEETVARHELVDRWFSAETQAALTALVERLRAGRKEVPR